MSEIIIKEMTEEDLKIMELQHDFCGQWCGFKNGEEMDNFKVDASQGMIRFGGSFVHHLGHALAHADSSNTAKIIKAFQDVCKEHAMLHLKWMKKRNKGEND